MSNVKYKFFCTNEDCENKYEYEIRIREEGDDEAGCDFCGEKMKLIGEEPYGGINKFNSLSSDEKKKVLLKRSHNHYNKFIKDKKEQYNKDFTNSVKEFKG